LLALQNNDNIYNLSVTLNGAPLSLTGYTLKFYQKASDKATDASAITYLVGSGITVVNSALGQIRWTIPHANITAPGQQWWRLDLTDTNSAIHTAFYGPLVIKAV
jgi:hypothetical protein